MNLPRFSVQNPVASNLIMWTILLGGMYYWLTMVREFFPNGEPEKFYISVRYPGATPEDVEKSVTRRIEREIEDVQNIKKIESKVLEGATAIVVSLERGASRDRVLSDLRGELDKVKAELPTGAEDPEITEQRPFIPVISVVIFGDVSEERLRDEAKKFKDDLVKFPEISEVFVSGVRKKEIWVEVRPQDLEKHSLSFEEVGQKIARMNQDMPGGQLSSLLGNIRVRTKEEKNRAIEMEKIILRSGEKGNTLRLVDLGEVKETFEDKVEKGRFKKQRAALITIFKTPEQDALQISGLVKKYVAENSHRLHGALEVTTTTDLSRFIQERLDLMLRNGRSGFILVVICLAFFLNMRVAFWVSMGIPTAFLGCFILMHYIGVTINLMSLFGLIVVLGMLVDDAIVVGENVYSKMEQGIPPHKAAIDGASEVAIPVIASVTTTMVAFLPLMFIEGLTGTFMAVLPKIVIAALAVSLLEAFLILPCHLAHMKIHPTSSIEENKKSGFLSSTKLGRFWKVLVDKKVYFLQEYVPGIFEKILRLALRWRYVAVTILFSFSIAVVGLVASRVVPFVFLQKLDGENLSINVEMSVGTREERTEEVIAQIEKKALKIPEIQSVFSVVGTSFSQEGRDSAADPATVGQLNLQLISAEIRQEKKMRSSQDIINDMRKEVGNIPGVKKIQFVVASGGPGGADIEVLVVGETLGQVIKVVDRVREELSTYDAVSNVEDDLNQGKREIRLHLREKAHSLGLTTQDLALQIRHALFGFKVQDLQEEGEEVTVRVLLPKSARQEISDLVQLKIVAPSGARIPLEEVAILSTSRGYGSLSRVDGRRAITIKAEVDEGRGNTDEITNDLMQRLSNISRDFPGITLSFEGRKKEAQESLGSLAIGFPAALLGIFAIIAVVFRSYIQTILIMIIIPYGLVGAILGHFLMGYPLTLLSMIGCVALSGIVVNDSIILVDLINRMRWEGKEVFEAIVTGAKGRLRAILLTSITTVFGLAPLMLEKSFQAQFLIPMAISLVFGLSFATLLVLMVIPCYYMILEDFYAIVRWLWSGFWSYEPMSSPEKSLLEAEKEKP